MRDICFEYFSAMFKLGNGLCLLPALMNFKKQSNKNPALPDVDPTKCRSQQEVVSELTRGFYSRPDRFVNSAKIAAEQAKVCSPTEQLCKPETHSKG